MMPAARKPRLANLSFSVKRLMRLGIMMKRVHQPSKKIFSVNNPRALPPKMMPSAMIAMPQMMGFACFIVVLLCIHYNRFKKDRTRLFRDRSYLVKLIISIYLTKSTIFLFFVTTSSLRICLIL